MADTSKNTRISKNTGAGTRPANAMWGGHYAQGPAEIMATINQSLDVDKRLAMEDIAGSIAHCTMLVRQGIIGAEDGSEIARGLGMIRSEIEAGTFPFRRELEDIHMNVEARLKELIGDAAGRLHTARSRNDQAVTDFRLFLRGACEKIESQLRALQEALLARAEEHAATVMPGFTHLQTAQPVTLGHHLLAYVEMFSRDRARMADCRERMNECPLGACALAGTSFPIDRDFTASFLGFSRPMRNSLDAVASRDFALEFLSAAAICATHLSRMAEEFILWTSAPFGFIRLSEAFTTGSSIMPQKRNPDAAELVRGKAGGIYGALTALLVTMKGLPLAYNKDMQEDKSSVFPALDALDLCLAATIGMVGDFTANAARMGEAAGQSYSTATDLADWLVRTLQVPFRDAHHITGKIVRAAEEQHCRLDELPLAAMQKVDPRVTADVFSVLSTANSVSSRTSFGGTAPDQVRARIAQWRRELSA